MREGGQTHACTHNPLHDNAEYDDPDSGPGRDALIEGAKDREKNGCEVEESRAYSCPVEHSFALIFRPC